MDARCAELLGELCRRNYAVISACRAALSPAPSSGMVIFSALHPLASAESTHMRVFIETRACLDYKTGFSAVVRSAGFWPRSGLGPF